MTELEKDLREILLKYGMNICEISIILVNEQRNILAIGFEEIEENNGTNSMCNRFKESNV